MAREEEIKQLEEELVSDFMLLPESGRHRFLMKRNREYLDLGDNESQNLAITQEQQKILDSIEAGKVRIIDLFGKGMLGPGTPEHTKAQRLYLSLEPFAKPTGEALGLTFGAIAGTSAPVPPPLGSVGGAGLGLGIARQTFDIIEGLLGLRASKGLVGELVESGLDIKKGMEDEMTGRGLAFGLGRAKKGLTFPLRKFGQVTGLSQKGAKSIAHRRFVEESTGTPLTQPQIDRNIKIARNVENIVRRTDHNFRFTQGQLTNDASAIALERALARHKGQDFAQEQRSLAIRALQDYYDSKLLDTGSISNLTRHVQRMEREIATSSRKAVRAVNAEVNRLSRHLDPDIVGQNIYDDLNQGKVALSKEASDLFDKIPEYKVRPSPLVFAIRQVDSEILPAEPPGRYPETIATILRQINPSRRPGAAVRNVSISSLRGINQSLRVEYKKAVKQENEVMKRRLKILFKAVQDTYDIAAREGGDQKGIETLREANRLRTMVDNRFEKGTVASVLQRGTRGEETRIAKANIAKAFDSIDGINDLLVAVDGNKDEAVKMMKDYYMFVLHDKAVALDGTVNANAALRWVGRNSKKLKKLGIMEEFTNLGKLQKNVDHLAKYADTFNKSMAGKMMNADPNRMIEVAFQGSKNFGATAGNLMKMVEGNPLAERGLKKAFAEHLMRESESTSLNFFQRGGLTPGSADFTVSLDRLTKQIQQFLPAIRVFYRNEPRKKLAILTVWKAFNILGRTAKSPVGGGLDTPEILGKAIDIVAGSTAPGKWYAYKSIRDKIERLGKANVEKYLRKAMFDPDYAETLIPTETTGSGFKPEQERAFTRLMTVLVNQLRSENVKEEEFSEEREVDIAEGQPGIPQAGLMTPQARQGAIGIPLPQR